MDRLENNKLLKFADSAEYLGLSEDTFAVFVTQHMVSYIYYKNTVMFNKTELDRFKYEILNGGLK